MTLELLAKEQSVSAPPLVRDRLTWFSYLLYGLWSFVWCIYSPIMPFLRAELHLSYASASLHFSGLALGLLLAGIFGFRIISGSSRRAAAWAGSIATCLASLSLLFPVHHFVTIASAIVVGFAGSIAAQAFMSTLTERYPNHRAVTIAELVVVNSLFAAATPLVVASLVDAHLSWRSIAFVPLVLLALIAVSTKGGGDAQWSHLEASAAAGGRLAPNYWLYFGIIFLTTAAEWSITFWCPDYLKSAHHFSAGAACQALSLFLLGMLAGRVASTALTKRFTAEHLLIATISLATVGFLLFWCSSVPSVIAAGLLLLGLGQANCYPLAFSAALAAAPNSTAKATSRMSISTGAAIFFAPLLLGLSADHIGITQSYGIVALLLVASVIAAAYSLRARTR